MSATLYPVVLAGGKGSRLWPLSSAQKPKQFIQYHHKTMLDHTLSRAYALSDHVFVVALDSFKDQLADSAYASRAHMLYEPYACNTAAAVVYAALSIVQKDPQAYLCFLPCDHYIAFLELFVQDIQHALACAQETGRLVLLGVPLHSPSTQYGYIVPQEPLLRSSAVTAFIEKPQQSYAQQLWEQNALCNCGIFVASAGIILQHAQDHLASTVENITRFLATGDPAEYKKNSSISWDKAVLEKQILRHVVQAQFEWMDIGAWNNFMSIARSPAQTYFAHAHTSDAYTKKPVVFCGVENTRVIETADKIFVMHKDFDTNTLLPFFENDL